MRPDRPGSRSFRSVNQLIDSDPTATNQLVHGLSRIVREQSSCTFGW
jgi:hypothetical protein